MNGEVISAAVTGSIKIFNALKKFFNDSQIANEVYDEIDKNIFLVAEAEGNYHYVADIKEDDIFDRFVSECLENAAWNTSIDVFVEKYYSNKSIDAKQYIKNFYRDIELVVWRTLTKHTSRNEKILLKGQEYSTEKILTRLEQIETSITGKTYENTVVVTYSANMQGKQWALDKVVSSRVDLSLGNFPLQPDEQNYWQCAQRSLIDQFDRRLRAFLDDGYTIDLYALAPIPLLVLLGNLFANRPNINIFQLKKVPSTFEWEENSEKLDIIIKKDLSQQHLDDVALILSFSGKVNKQNVIDVIGNNCPMIEMAIEDIYDDFLRSKKQLDEFLTAYRKVKSSLSDKGVKRIHLFAAIPVAIAIGIGQAYNSNYDPQIVTYDFKQGIYTRALTIGEK